MRERLVIVMGNVLAFLSVFSNHEAESVEGAVWRGGVGFDISTFRV